MNNSYDTLFDITEINDASVLFLLDHEIAQLKWSHTFKKNKKNCSIDALSYTFLEGLYFRTRLLGKWL
jgi:hypothetical protein